MSEVIDISGSVSVPHDGLKRGDRVRIVVDGHVGGYSEKDTAHKGTEYKFTVRSEAGVILKADEFARFDNAIAEAKAAQGALDERQGALDVDGDEPGELPIGDDE